MRVLAATLLGAVLTAFVSVRAFDPDVFHHDKAWILYTAGAMLDGETLYVDLLDENPPLVFWTAVPAVALARWLGVAPVQVYDLAVWLAIVGSLTATFALLQRSADAGAFRDGPLVLTALLAAVLVLLPGSDFGQREHLLFILSLPYLAGAVRCLEGRPLGVRSGVAVGLLAGVGVAFKPYFAALPALVELSLLVLRHDTGSLRRAEPWTLAGLQGVYAVGILVFAPAWLDLLELTWPVYNAYNVSIPAFRIETLALLAGVVGVALVRPSGLPGRIARVAVAAGIAALIVGYVQRKGWDYHFLPAALAATLLFASLALAVAERFGTAPAKSRFALALVGVAIVASAWRLTLAVDESFGEASLEPSVNRVLSALAREHASGQAILFLGTSVNPAFPVVNLSGTRWGQRFCCLWVLPAVYSAEEKRGVPFPYHDVDDMGDLERFGLDALVADMAADPPALIVVDSGRWKFAFGRTDFSHLAYFLRDPRFAERFREYELIANVAVFQVFRRVPRVE